MVCRPEPKNSAKNILKNKILFFNMNVKLNFKISTVEIFIMEKEYKREEIIIGISETYTILIIGPKINP